MARLHVSLDSAQSSSDASTDDDQDDDDLQTDEALRLIFLEAVHHPHKALQDFRALYQRTAGRLELSPLYNRTAGRLETAFDNIYLDPRTANKNLRSQINCVMKESFLWHEQLRGLGLYLHFGPSALTRQFLEKLRLLEGLRRDDGGKRIGLTFDQVWTLLNQERQARQIGAARTTANNLVEWMPDDCSRAAKIAEEKWGFGPPQKPSKKRKPRPPSTVEEEEEEAEEQNVDTGEGRDAAATSSRAKEDDRSGEKQSKTAKAGSERCAAAEKAQDTAASAGEDAAPLPGEGEEDSDRHQQRNAPLHDDDDDEDEDDEMQRIDAAEQRRSVVSETTGMDIEMPRGRISSRASLPRSPSPAPAFLSSSPCLQPSSASPHLHSSGSPKFHIRRDSAESLNHAGSIFGDHIGHCIPAAADDEGLFQLDSPAYTSPSIFAQPSAETNMKQRRRLSSTSPCASSKRKRQEGATTRFIREHFQPPGAQQRQQSLLELTHAFLSGFATNDVSVCPPRRTPRHAYILAHNMHSPQLPAVILLSLGSLQSQDEMPGKWCVVRMHTEELGNPPTVNVHGLAPDENVRLYVLEVLKTHLSAETCSIVERVPLTGYHEALPVELEDEHFSADADMAAKNHLQSVAILTHFLVGQDIPQTISAWAWAGALAASQSCNGRTSDCVRAVELPPAPLVEPGSFEEEKEGEEEDADPLSAGVQHYRSQLRARDAQLSAVTAYEGHLRSLRKFFQPSTDRSHTRDNPRMAAIAAEITTLQEVQRLFNAQHPMHVSAQTQIKSLEKERQSLVRAGQAERWRDIGVWISLSIAECEHEREFLMKAADRTVSRLQSALADIQDLLGEYQSATGSALH